MVNLLYFPFRYLFDNEISSVETGSFSHRFLEQLLVKFLCTDQFLSL